MQLSLYESGAGPRRVALVHGLGGNADTWKPLVDRMLATGRYTVTTVDLRGHGSSGRASSYGLAALADDVVETLPQGLDSIVGHSLGGSVLARAVNRLAPKHAIYLDPGFHLALPTTGIAGRLFWLAPPLTLGVAQALRVRGSLKARSAMSAEIRASVDRAQKEFDRSMALGVFREVAYNPVPSARPDVPSTIVLSDDSPSVLPDTVVPAFERNGWDVRRMAGIHHDMHLENADGVYDLLEDVL